MTNNTMGLTNGKDEKYLAKVWRTETLRQAAEDEVEILLHGFLADGDKLIIEQRPNGSWVGKAMKPTPSDANIMAEGRTPGEVKARLLGIFLAGGGWFPLT